MKASAPPFTSLGLLFTMAKTNHFTLYITIVFCPSVDPAIDPLINCTV